MHGLPGPDRIARFLAYLFESYSMRFSRTVWLLGIVSLLADVSSELLYPVLPVYLREAGYSMIALGMLEGLSQVIAGFSKGYFGHLSDGSQQRQRFIQAGYGLSAIGKILLLYQPGLLRIFLARGIDRLGKGVRSAPRDALLASEAAPEQRARVFGFHRGMDTLGAALGPLLALLWLYFYPGDYGGVFVLAVVPAVLSTACTFLVKDRRAVSATGKGKQPGFFSYLGFWKNSTGDFRRLMAPLLLFALVNSPDVFLLMALKEAGLSDLRMIAAYIVYNLLYAAFAYPVGVLADQVGKRKVLCAGVLLFAAVYAGMTRSIEFHWFVVLFGVYALAIAAIESVVKAAIVDIVPANDRGKALGFYMSTGSIGTLLAGVWTGALWSWGGPSAVFSITAVAAFLAGIWLVRQNSQG